LLDGTVTVVAGSLLFHGDVLDILKYCLKYGRLRLILKLTKGDATLSDMRVRWMRSSLKVFGGWV
jgi:hypothetical protein